MNADEHHQWELEQQEQLEDRMELTFDIETIPGQSPWVKEYLRSRLEPPGNISKQETIDKWWAEKAEGVLDERWRKTALDPTMGEILALGWQWNDEEPQGRIRTLEQEENVLIAAFLDDLSARLEQGQGNHRKIHRWIGHAIRDFDIPFFYIRCVINNIRPTIKLPLDAKPWDGTIFDTKLEWAKRGSATSASLDVIDRALGGQGKPGIDGSKVWDAVLEGRYDEILSYCRDYDVPRTYNIYQRLNFL